MNAARVVKIITVILLIVGALNLGIFGAFNFNVIGHLFGDFSVVTRVIYVLIGLAGLYKLFLVVHK